MLIKENFNFMFSFILIIRLIQLPLKECDRETPILFNNETCKSMSCTNTQFDLRQCLINNSIIRQQWLNNIIIVGKQNSTFINFAKYSNGDLVILSEDNISSGNRYFFGLKNNGRSFFTDWDGKETLYYYLNTQNYDNTDIDREISVITIDSTKEEYIINIQKRESYAELFDFENNITYKKKTSELLGNEITESRGSFINSKQKNYFLICSLVNNDNDENSGFNKFLFIAQKLMFDTKESIENDDNCYFAVILGDMINAQHNFPNLMMGVSYTSKPLFATAGNHDLYFGQWTEYLQYWHSSTYYFTARTPNYKDLYICMDSGDGTFGRKQLSWLKNTLKEKSQEGFRHIVLFTHTHLYKRDSSQGHISNFPLEETYEIADLLGSYGVDWYVSGHAHSRAVSDMKGVKYIIVDTMKDSAKQPAYMTASVGSKLNYHFVELLLVEYFVHYIVVLQVDL